MTAGFALVSPVVAVGRVYAHPTSRPVLVAEPEAFSKPRLYVELAGKFPEFRYFSWDVSAAGSGIRAGREFVARGAALLWSGYALLGVFLFYGLFQRFERGEVFELASVRRLKLVGAWVMGIWVMGLAMQLSKTWWAVSANYEIDLGAGLLPGLFIFLLGWILEEARLVAEEQALTV